MANSTEGLVPITRSFLARYYDKYPLDPLPADVARLTDELRGLSRDLAKESPLTSGELIFTLLLIDPSFYFSSPSFLILDQLALQFEGNS